MREGSQPTYNDNDDNFFFDDSDDDVMSVTNDEYWTYLNFYTDNSIGPLTYNDCYILKFNFYFPMETDLWYTDGDYTGFYYDWGNGWSGDLYIA